jgi:hypothetical protein
MLHCGCTVLGAPGSILGSISSIFGSILLLFGIHFGCFGCSFAVILYSYTCGCNWLPCSLSLGNPGSSIFRSILLLFGIHFGCLGCNFSAILYTYTHTCIYTYTYYFERLSPYEHESKPKNWFRGPFAPNAPMLWLHFASIQSFFRPSRIHCGILLLHFGLNSASLWNPIWLSR